MTIRQLYAMDAQFLYLQTKNNLTHIMGISIFDPSTAPGGVVRFKDILRHVESRINTSPLYKRKLYKTPLNIDRPYWVEDKDFDLEAHVTHARLPHPGDWRQLCILASRHFSRPMDMSRPLWDMFVVEGLDNIEGVKSGSYALLQRTHHAAVDGVSAIQSFAAMADIDAKGTPIIPIVDRSDEIGDEPTPGEIWGRALESNINSPIKLAELLVKKSPAFIDTIFGLGVNRSDKEGKSKEESGPRQWVDRFGGVPKTRFNTVPSQHKMFDGTSIDLDRVKNIRKKIPNATINDAVLAIISGALREYLLGHDELPEKSLVAIAPINRRTSHEDGEGPRNNITQMRIKIASDIANPIERLAAIVQETRRAKMDRNGVSARLLTDIGEHIPGATMAGVSRLVTSEQFALRACNLIISNVPGPQFPMYMNGAQMTYSFGMAPLAANMGLFVATPSYNGKISFSLTSTREIAPDIARIRELIEEEVDKLEAANPPSPGKEKEAKDIQGQKAPSEKRRKRRVPHIIHP